MNLADKKEFERLINKPRAFRNAYPAPGIMPERRTMILLGSGLNTQEVPKHCSIFIRNRKYKHESLF